MSSDKRNRDCSLCGVEIAKAPCTHALVTDEQVTMSHAEWVRQTDLLDELRAENAALREIAQAVANLPIQDTWHGNTTELYHCEYFHVFDEDAHALVDRARALLGDGTQP